MKSKWSDGTTALLFEPIEFLERLAVLTPRPRINLVLYHGASTEHLSVIQSASACTSACVTPGW